jgi:arsenate reductase (thioredoxin)
MKILVLCTGNSARSQMAEGWFHHLAPTIEVESAGFKPKGVNPLALEAMREVGADISAQTSKTLSSLELTGWDYVITVCALAETACPIFPGKTKRLYWPFNDPAAVTGSHPQQLEAFRTVRDQLKLRVQEFVLNLENTDLENTNLEIAKETS